MTESQFSSDKERELVEAARALEMSFSEQGERTAENNWHCTDYTYRQRLATALRAYDPPKRNYTMPTWEEFLVIFGGSGDMETTWIRQGPKAPVVDKNVYNAILKALSTESQ